MPGRNPRPTLSEDEREAFEERAAILEFDAGMTREEAETLALEAVIRLRIKSHPSHRRTPWKK